MSLNTDNAVFVLIDIQGKLAELMTDKEATLDALETLITAMHILDIPILWTEQLPEKLGSTIPRLQSLLTDEHPIAKSSFSCWGSDDFQAALAGTGRRQVLLAGIETHICVYQTVAGLLQNGYTVDIVADACSSRTPENKKIGLKRCREERST